MLDVTRKYRSEDKFIRHGMKIEDEKGARATVFQRKRKGKERIHYFLEEKKVC